MLGSRRASLPPRSCWGAEEQRQFQNHTNNGKVTAALGACGGRCTEVLGGASAAGLPSGAVAVGCQGGLPGGGEVGAEI